MSAVSDKRFETSREHYLADHAVSHFSLPTALTADKSDGKATTFADYPASVATFPLMDYSRALQKRESVVDSGATEMKTLGAQCREQRVGGEGTLNRQHFVCHGLALGS